MSRSLLLVRFGDPIVLDDLTLGLTLVDRSSIEPAPFPIAQGPVVTHTFVFTWRGVGATEVLTFFDSLFDRHRDDFVNVTFLRFRWDLVGRVEVPVIVLDAIDRKSTRLNSSHVKISYAVFCLKKKKKKKI